MAETTSLMVSYSTPLAVIEELRKRVVGYVFVHLWREKSLPHLYTQRYAANNNREWASAGVNIDKMEYMNCIWLVVAVEREFFASFPASFLNLFL